MNTVTDGTSSRVAFEKRKTLIELLDDPCSAFSVRRLRDATTLETYLARRAGWVDAEDIAQETYIRFYANPNMRNLRSANAFLFGIANHVLHRHWLVRMREPVGIDSDAAANAIEDTSEQHLHEQLLAERRISKIREHLSPQYLRVLELRYVEGLSHRYIADRLGISTKSVSKYLARALQSARALFPELWPRLRSSHATVHKRRRNCATRLTPTAGTPFQDATAPSSRHPSA